MPLSKIFLILFIVGPTFPFFIPVCLNNSWWCTRHHSWMLKTEEEFLFNLALFSSRFVILACCHPLVIVLIVRILFTYPEQFKILLSLIIRRPSFRDYSFSAFSYHSPILRCFAQVIFNRLVISSFSFM